MAGRILQPLPQIDDVPAPTPVLVADPSMTDWGLFTSMIVAIMCVLVLLVAVGYATLSSPTKPKPKVVKKDS